MSPTTLTFKVQRYQPELITPAKPTPHEFKPLSDLDDRDIFRFHQSAIFFFHSNPSMNGIDPARVVRTAVAETLVYYYPYAGRLRELSPSRKLIVECTAEGVLFVEADADITLDEFGYPLVPPFPCWDQLMVELPEPNDFLNLPLFLIQVTRLKCGGFTFACRYNHTMSDAYGIAQFVRTIAEIAKGATSPSVLPTWKRDIFSSQNPPLLTCPLPEYNINVSDFVYDKNMVSDMCCQCFFFGRAEISALRKYFGHKYDLQQCTSFDLISASVLRCRVIALRPHPEEEMGLIRIANLRGKFKDLVPVGYYGNAIASAISTSSVKEILSNPLQVVRNATDKVTKEYVRNVIHLVVTNNRKSDLPVSMKYYLESNWRHVGMEDLDFGWGKALYVGPAVCSSPSILIYTPFKDGLMLPLCLPKQAMQRFVKEMNNMLKCHQIGGDDNALKSKM